MRAPTILLNLFVTLLATEFINGMVKRTQIAIPTINLEDVQRCFTGDTFVECIDYLDVNAPIDANVTYCQRQRLAADCFIAGITEDCQHKQQLIDYFSDWGC